jgi:uncharacterized repeat protein (TIGR01451 family)
VDDEGNPVSDFDSATVDIVEPDAPSPPGDLRVVKTTTTPTIPEPGGTAHYEILVSNVSTTPVTLQSIVDIVDDVETDLYTTCQLPIVLKFDEPPFFCNFTQQVTGNPNDIITDLVRVSGEDGLSTRNIIIAEDTASVEITNVPSDISLSKNASPSSVPEPGSSVNFTLTVVNESSVDSVEITSLVDSELGVPNGDCLLPQSLASNGGTYSCTYSGLVTGNAGDSVTNTLTATGSDDDGSLVEATAFETVLITGAPPSLNITKTAIPNFALTSGSEVTYFLTITNDSNSADPIALTSLSDEVDGVITDLEGVGSCQIAGRVLPPAPDPNSIYQCSFPVTVSGPPSSIVKNIATVSGEDDESTQATASAEEEVTIVTVEVDEPQLALAKIATPREVPEPGGDVTYVVVVANASDPNNPLLDLTMMSADDSRYGNLYGLGTCNNLENLVLQPGDFSVCQYTENVAGDPNEVITNTIVALAQDTLTRPASATGSANVRITPIDSTISVTKLADVSSILEPGENVTFSISITNTSQVDVVDILTITDSIYGDLDEQGSCSIPQSLPVGAQYNCAFTVEVTGEGGDSEVNTVTVTGVDDDGQEVVGTAQESVDILDRPPTISAVKRANPSIISSPGASVEFIFTVQNTSETDTVNVTSIIDSVYGDLNRKGDCSVPQTILAGAEYECSFTETVIGDSGTSHVDIIAVSGAAEDGTPVGTRAVAFVQIIAVIRAIPALGQFGLASLILLTIWLGYRRLAKHA